MSIYKDISEFYNIPIFHKAKLLKKIRGEWHEPKRKWRDYSKISCLLELTTTRDQKEVVDNKTWYDLGMNLVFDNVDVTMTEVGQQTLYKNMHLLEDDTHNLQIKYGLASRLKKDRKLRESLQVCLYPLSLISANPAVKFLFKEPNLVKIPKRLAVVLFMVSVCVLLSCVLFQLGFLYFSALLVVVINLYISRRFLSIVEPYSDALVCIRAIISVSHFISKQKFSDSIDQVKRIRKEISGVRRSNVILGMLLFSQSSPNFLIGYPMFLVNLLVPVDILVYSLLITPIKRDIKTMRLCFELIGEIDASIALASYLERHPGHCNPELSLEQSLNFKDVRHPLIADCVENSFKSQGESALITGSNMAGKTTFIRVLGINIILARTFWLCHAREAIVPIRNIASSIANTDLLEEGKSYYFSEIEQVNRFLRLSESHEKYIFLIDEIFRGTNTIERIGGAAAVLQKLAEGNIVFVTTHDRELEDYLGKSYLMWHFHETGNKETPFDYKLRSGVCRSRNALKLMASLGFPREIIERAKIVAKDVEERQERGRESFENSKQFPDDR